MNQDQQLGDALDAINAKLTEINGRVSRINQRIDQIAVDTREMTLKLSRVNRTVETVLRWVKFAAVLALVIFICEVITIAGHA